MKIRFRMQLLSSIFKKEILLKFWKGKFLEIFLEIFLFEFSKKEKKFFICRGFFPLPNTAQDPCSKFRLRLSCPFRKICNSWVFCWQLGLRDVSVRGFRFPITRFCRSPRGTRTRYPHEVSQQSLVNWKAPKTMNWNISSKEWTIVHCLKYGMQWKWLFKGVIDQFVCHAKLERLLRTCEHCLSNVA